MANYDIEKVYDENIRKLENSDPASAEEVFNPLIQKMLNNTAYLKGEVDGVKSGSLKAGNSERLNGRSEDHFATKDDLSRIPAPTWGNLSGKPNVFPTDWNNVNGKPDKYPALLNDIRENIYINKSDGRIFFNSECSIGIDGENFTIREPEDGNREWFRIDDDGEAYVMEHMIYNTANLDWDRLQGKPSIFPANTLGGHSASYFAKSGDLSSMITSGSNSNGYWIKFNDGTMICYKHFTKMPTNTYGNTVWIYPSEFISSPVVSCEGYYSSGTILSLSKNNVKVGDLHYSYQDILFLAVGRWK